MKLALPVEYSVFPFTRWTLRTGPLTAIPGVMRVRSYTGFRLVGTAHLFMPVPIAVIA
jgi:hypothetical protein